MKEEKELPKEITDIVLDTYNARVRDRLEHPLLAALPFAKTAKGIVGFCFDPMGTAIEKAIQTITKRDPSLNGMIMRIAAYHDIELSLGDAVKFLAALTDRKVALLKLLACENGLTVNELDALQEIAKSAHEIFSLPTVESLKKLGKDTLTVAKLISLIP